jgi:hypothetical protein
LGIRCARRLDPVPNRFSPIVEEVFRAKFPKAPVEGAVVEDHKEVLPKLADPPVLARGSPNGWLLEGGSRALVSSSGSSVIGSFNSVLRRGSQSSRENRLAVGEAMLALGKGFVSAVSLLRVPGREAVEGEDIG